jgi:hypothetical protein
MNRASGTQGHRYFDAYATRNKTLETKTLDAGRGPTKFFIGEPGRSDTTLDTVASNVSSAFLGARWSQPGTAVGSTAESACVRSSPPGHPIAIIDGAVPIGRTDRRVCACLASRDVFRTRWQSVMTF